MLTRNFLLRRFRSDTFFAFCCLWLAGLLCGTAASCFIRKDLFSLMGATSFYSTSIVCQITFHFLPFLITALTVLIGKSQFLTVIILGRAFLYAFYGCLVYLSFGTAGWLVQPLLQFSGLMCAPLFCWFSMRQMPGTGFRLRRDLGLCFAWIILISCVDHYVVSPFLERLIMGLERYAYSCWI